MTSEVVQAAASLVGSKRKQPEEVAPATAEPASKALKTEGISSKYGMKPIKRAPMSKAREIRLEQNRKAARESRRRKKVMIEELQRSVIFFSRANGTLKQQNEELSRLFMQAQAQVAVIESQQNGGAAPVAPVPVAKVKAEGEQQPQQGGIQQNQAQAVATQAMYESQGFPAAAARAAAQTINAGAANAQSSAPGAASQASLPPMQPGATMQAMANFQQAAAAAMQAAVQGMQSVPGISLNALSVAPSGANAQQAYNDTMTALAMQQAAAAAAAGQQFFQNNPFAAHQMVAWQNSQAAQAPVQAAAQAQAAPAPAPVAQAPAPTQQ